jgi:GT2 family glycosyltransferase
VASANLSFAYDVWIKSKERNAELANHSREAIAKWRWRPHFSILLYTQGSFTPEQLARSLASAESQLYRAWTIDGVPDHSLSDRFASATGDYIIPLRVGHVLSDAALFRLAEALQSEPSGAIIYGDEDELDSRGRRHHPWFKPRWNAEMFLALDYLSAAVAIEAALARSVVRSGSDDLNVLLLAATSAAKAPIVHVPHILCHIDGTSGDRPPSDRMSAVARHVAPTGATCARGPFGTVKVEWPLPAKLPLVSIIIPTKDKLELLQPCVHSVLEQTDYRDFEILIVDNASVERRTIEYLRTIVDKVQVRVLNYNKPYNFSSINNFAAQHAKGSYLCLLNNDTEVISTEWLTAMMRYATRADIGAVGAKLLYEDGTIQHAGVVVGIGQAAGHAHRFVSADDPGYFRQPHVTQFVSAVTAACLVVEKRKFEASGGLDEANLAVAFNDVDLCLKLQAAGWCNVYVPHAVLLHHESKSRGKDISPENVDRYRRELRFLQERWGTKTYNDPTHNPNLDRYSETFVFSL